jgi:hypothetical protein
MFNYLPEEDEMKVPGSANVPHRLVVSPRLQIVLPDVAVH